MLADILYVIGHERLCRALTDFRFVFRVKQRRSICRGRRDERNPLDKDRPPVDWTHGHRLTGLFQTPLRRGYSQCRLTISVLQDDMSPDNFRASIAGAESTALGAHV